MVEKIEKNIPLKKNKKWLSTTLLDELSLQWWKKHQKKVGQLQNLEENDEMRKSQDEIRNKNIKIN